METRLETVGFDNACLHAAQTNDLDFLKFARQRHCPWNNNHFPCDVAKCGGIEMLDWALKNGCPWDDAMCAYAAATGCLDKVKLIYEWAKKHHFKWTTYLGTIAARRGRLNILQWYSNIDSNWRSSYICSHAAAGGHLEVLQWAVQNGCRMSVYTCESAAENGHLHILKWARANECPWNEDTCAVAANHGHFDILKWAHANGCPWNENTCNYAALKGHLHILQWALDMRCPSNNVVMMYAANYSQWRVAEWCLKNKFTMQDIYKRYVIFYVRHYFSLKWLVETHGFFGDHGKKWFDVFEEVLDSVMHVPDMSYLIKIYI